ncbi:uncharacterized protein KQ657_001085 [Scheffersomyces spartinae]|uniref:Signal recognition particle subunit SRP14 n=1 Tax=Scheffersomyces spartinae TaxID=45513 RepID=A0A9P8AIC5_9ASCO|nr:uncharacterized protein KQ657_001085 [Scheffersomyces spartinae]KAG7192975.1 hypothetical protein KQ657_001085 [Scheffersomyces spartinae]
MGRLTNSDFLKELKAILGANEGKSSVYLVQKRLSTPLPVEMSEKEDSISDLPSNVVVNNHFNNNTQQYPVLVRVATGHNEKKTKQKLSTVVEVDQLDQFWVDYVQVIKSGFVGLKKKEKKKAKKGKVSK